MGATTRVLQHGVFNEVQAALLNSECSPQEAVKQAMLAIVQFAHCEADMNEDKIRDEVKEAWALGPEEGLW